MCDKCTPTALVKRILIDPTDFTPHTSTYDACIHQQCQTCNGTGIRKDGRGNCVHAISCKCKSCTPWD